MQQIETSDIGNDEWLKASKELVSSSNIICITEDEHKTSDYNPLIWFGTNLTQYLSRFGDSEVCPLFGKQINTIDDFSYQLCRTIPWGFEMGRNLNAVYDVLLNFTTQPKNRYFIWHDAQHLFRADRKLFDCLYESLIVASYLNSNGKATQNYQVNQKVILLFDNTSENEISELLNVNYYTPSIFDNFDTEDKYYILHKQTLVMTK
jgi:RNAse (barnase) inhibitor barstar